METASAKAPWNYCSTLRKEALFVDEDEGPGLVLAPVKDGLHVRTILEFPSQQGLQEGDIIVSIDGASLGEEICGEEKQEAVFQQLQRHGAVLEVMEGWEEPEAEVRFRCPQCFRGFTSWPPCLQHHLLAWHAERKDQGGSDEDSQPGTREMREWMAKAAAAARQHKQDGLGRSREGEDPPKPPDNPPLPSLLAVAGVPRLPHPAEGSEAVDLREQETVQEQAAREYVDSDSSDSEVFFMDKNPGPFLAPPDTSLAPCDLEALAPDPDPASQSPTPEPVPTPVPARQHLMSLRVLRSAAPPREGDEERPRCLALPKGVVDQSAAAACGDADVQNQQLAACPPAQQASTSLGVANPSPVVSQSKAGPMTRFKNQGADSPEEPATLRRPSHPSDACGSGPISGITNGHTKFNHQSARADLPSLQSEHPAAPSSQRPLVFHQQQRMMAQPESTQLSQSQQLSQLLAHPGRLPPSQQPSAQKSCTHDASNAAGRTPKEESTSTPKVPAGSVKVVIDAPAKEGFSADAPEPSQSRSRARSASRQRGRSSRTRSVSQQPPAPPPKTWWAQFFNLRRLRAPGAAWLRVFLPKMHLRDADLQSLAFALDLLLDDLRAELGRGVGEDAGARCKPPTSNNPFA